ncbi:MAG TPA: hypothetical protein VN034_00025 [Sphingopyxis sp.]|nr:hypothetical protein [Sphingopyxis sp.]
MATIEMCAESLKDLICGTEKTRCRRSNNPRLAEDLHKPVDRRRVAAAQTAAPIFILKKASD